MVLHEESQARALARRLHGAGFGAEVVREPFAGEDDDEDQPWAVVTDAPTFMIEVFAEEYDCWLDDGPSEPTAPLLPPPLDLPTAPRRVKGHFPDN